MSPLLSVAGLAALYLMRDRLWEDELVRRMVNYGKIGGFPFLQGMLLWGGCGFAMFAVVGGWLILETARATWQAEPLMFEGPGSGLMILVVGMAFTALTWSAGLYAVFAYGQWKIQTFPPPIFLNQDVLARVVAQEINWRIRLKLRRQQPSVRIRMMGLKRSQNGGLTGMVRSEASTDKTEGDHYLRAVQYWRVASDRWGNVTMLAQEGSPSYVSDSTRPYEQPESKPKSAISTAETNALALEGEVLLLEEPAPASMRKAMIYAVMAANLKRER